MFKLSFPSAAACGRLVEWNGWNCPIGLSPEAAFSHTQRLFARARRELPQPFARPLIEKLQGNQRHQHRQDAREGEGFHPVRYRGAHLCAYDYPDRQGEDHVRQRVEVSEDEMKRHSEGGGEEKLALRGGGGDVGRNAQNPYHQRHVHGAAPDAQESRQKTHDGTQEGAEPEAEGVFIDFALAVHDAPVRERADAARILARRLERRRRVDDRYAENQQGETQQDIERPARDLARGEDADDRPDRAGQGERNAGLDVDSLLAVIGDRPRKRVQADHAERGGGDDLGRLVGEYQQKQGREDEAAARAHQRAQNADAQAHRQELNEKQHGKPSFRCKKRRRGASGGFGRRCVYGTRSSCLALMGPESNTG